MSGETFKLVSDFKPTGDQPQAIEALVAGLRSNKRFQTLLGVTGSGKTFTMANVIAQVNRPTLIMAHNKTLAAQLYSEFKGFFPENAVEYFVSYYDYYQPEAYIAASDTYIEKDSAINDEIDKLRHSATRSLLERRDVIIISSVSCIYGLGSPESYLKMMIRVSRGEKIRRDDFLRRLVEVGYQRSDLDFHRGSFRVRGDVVDVFPANESLRAVRFEFFGNCLEKIDELDPLTGARLSSIPKAAIYPATHYVVEAEQKKAAMATIQEELRERLGELKELSKAVEAQRLETRTLYDIEMMGEVGYCPGIENYSRHITGKKAGEPPPTLFNYFDEDWLLIVDESHVSVPQVGAMYRGDRARKMSLVEHGFRLPSALDNRPLKFEEWEAGISQVLYVSATPGPYELGKTGGEFVEQVIRPTGLIDPTIEIRPAKDQVRDLMEQCLKRAAVGERSLVTTLTKKMAEDLTDFFRDQGVRVKYLHSDVDTLDRVEILRELRAGKFDVLVGINLLREGLDLPEVSLVGILDADKEGFLRSRTSLIQTFGRAARNINGHVILYADKITRSMNEAMAETDRRRAIQVEYNTAHGITPVSIVRASKNLVTDRVVQVANSDYVDLTSEPLDDEGVPLKPSEISRFLSTLEKQMKESAKNLQFEEAAQIRDKILRYREIELKWLPEKSASLKNVL